MAILLDREWGGAFYDAYALECATDKDIATAARLQKQEKEWKREGRKRVMAEGKHPFWARAIERPKTEDLQVKKLKLTKGDALPDYVHMSRAGRLVSDRFKAVIEGVEPAGQGLQFFAVEIETKDGAPYFHWDVFRRIDALDPKSEGIETVMGPVDGNHSWTFESTPEPKTRDQLILSQAKIEGLAAWSDFRFMSDYVFISDNLHEKMIGAQLTGFSAHSVWSER